MEKASVSAGMASGLINYALGRGVATEKLLNAAGLIASELENPDNRIPLEQYISLTRTAEIETKNEAFSLHYAENVGMSEVSVVGLIMEASATMGEAFLQLQRYGRLAVEFDEPGNVPHFILRQLNKKLLMEDQRKAANDFHQLREAAFVRLTCGPRRFLERPHILSVHFTHAPPRYRDEYARIFQCPVHFEASMNALELHPETPNWMVSSSPQYAFSVLTKHGDSLLTKLDAVRSWGGKTESAMLKRLHKGEVKADIIAADLGFSRQTLFRKLKMEDASFSQILDDLRRKMAREYLAAGHTSVNEIAYLLGFSESASFSRAFKKWEGLSPTEFQNRSSSAGN